MISCLLTVSPDEAWAWYVYLFLALFVVTVIIIVIIIVVLCIRKRNSQKNKVSSSQENLAKGGKRKYMSKDFDWPNYNNLMWTHLLSSEFLGWCMSLACHWPTPAVSVSMYKADYRAPGEYHCNIAFVSFHH